MREKSTNPKWWDAKNIRIWDGTKRLRDSPVLIDSFNKQLGIILCKTVLKEYITIIHQSGGG